MTRQAQAGLAETAPAAGFEPAPRDDEAASPPAGDRSRQAMLAGSMEDAQILIWYASRSGVPVEEEVMKNLAETRSAHEQGRWSPAEEARFWTALNKLARAVRPVTVASIKASTEYGGSSHDRTRRVVQRYRRATLGVLLLLLLAQIYWLIGNNFATQIDTLQGDVSTQMDTLARLQGRLRAVEVDLEEESGRLIALMSADRPEEVLLPARRRVTELSRQQQELEVEIARSERLLEAATNMLASSQILLQGWDIFTGEEDPLRILTASRERATTTGKETAAAADPRRRYADNLTLLASRSALSTFNQYVLPLLYGLVGALAFILRTLSREMAAVTYSPADNLRYSLRWPLGMLAGITVGWFFDPESLTGLAAIQPLALAFLAGYGVELLFAGLDRIVSAFTGGDGKSRAAAA